MSVFLRRIEFRRAAARVERDVAVDSEEAEVTVVALIADTLERLETFPLYALPLAAVLRGAEASRALFAHSMRSPGGEQRGCGTLGCAAGDTFSLASADGKLGGGLLVLAAMYGGGDVRPGNSQPNGFHERSAGEEPVGETPVVPAGETPGPPSPAPTRPRPSGSDRGVWSPASEPASLASAMISSVELQKPRMYVELGATEGAEGRGAGGPVSDRASRRQLPLPGCGAPGASA